MEHADEVLAVARIDRGLAADRGIHLRQQRGRHLHIVEPAPHCRGREARKVANHAASQRHHKIASPDPGADQGLAYTFEAGKALRSLSGLDDDVVRRKSVSRERSLGGLEVQTGAGIVSHDRGFRARLERCRTRPKGRHLVAPYHDVISTLAERNCDDLGIPRSERRSHGWSSRPQAAIPSLLRSAVTISSPMTSCGTSRDTTTRLASP